jgi:HSP20 family protein
MYRTLFSRDLLAEFDRLQRDVGSLFDHSPAIRGLGRGGYPALNVGGTPTGVEVFAFAPGVDPASVDVQLDRGVLTIAGERKAAMPVAGDGSDGKAHLHLNERFSGRFRRVVNLPDDIDPASVSASFRDGVLRIAATRKAAAQPRRIEVN